MTFSVRSPPYGCRRRPWRVTTRSRSPPASEKRPALLPADGQKELSEYDERCPRGGTQSGEPRGTRLPIITRGVLEDPPTLGNGGQRPAGALRTPQAPAAAA